MHLDHNNGMGATHHLLTISIVVPAYNVAKWIDEAIASILVQEPRPHEVIIVNDGSTDTTGEVLRAYEQHPMVTVITQQNQGLGAARNIGLARCTGEYVYFMDSDDYIEPMFMARISAEIVNNQFPDVVLFAGVGFADKGVTLATVPTFPRTSAKFPDDGSLLRTLVDRKCMHALATLYVSKRRLWTDLPLSFPSIIHEDEAVVFQLMTGATSAVVIPDTLYRYRIRAASIMSEGTTPKTMHAAREITTNFIREVQERGRVADPLVDLWRWRGAYWAEKYVRTARSLHGQLDRRLAIRAALTFRSMTLAKELLWSVVPRSVYSALRRARDIFRARRA